MKKLLSLLVLFFFQHSYADLDVENYMELSKEVRASENLVFSQFGLSLYDNESILETLPNCEVLKEQTLFTHKCVGDEITYVLKLNESKVCNKDFESRRLKSESINEWNEKNEKLPFNYCLVAFRVITSLKEAELKSKIDEIITKYGPPNAQTSKVERPSALNQIVPLILGQTFMWDKYAEINPQNYDPYNYLSSGPRVEIKSYAKGKDDLVKVRITTYLDEAYKEKSFDFNLWFEWALYLLVPFIYIAITTNSVKSVMKSSFSKNKGNVHYADNTFKRYVTMYLFPAGLQLLVNIPGWFGVIILYTLLGMRGGDIFCQVLTPSFCDATSGYDGNYQLLMTIAVIYTLQLIILVCNAKRMGERYLLRKK